MNRVVWTRSATAGLATLWTEATSSQRQRITQQLRELDQSLRRDPASVGEGRGLLFRVTFIDDAVIEFRVEATDRLAVVTKIRPLRRRPLM